jgi:histidinol-phosphate aminotransferase
MAFGHDLEAMARCVTDRTRLVFIANPNNPTGTWLTEAPLRAFLQALPATVVTLVDEAYFEYVSVAGYPDCSRWLDEFPNLVVTRTFSKAHGLAGVRVGYGLSHPVIADALNRVRQPFNVNSLAMAAAVASLADPSHVQRGVALNRQGMQQLREAFAAMPLRCFPSAGNFVLVDCGLPSGNVYEALLRLGIIVRPVAGYGLATHVRITVGTHAQNQRLIDAMRRVLHK